MDVLVTAVDCNGVYGRDVTGVDLADDLGGLQVMRLPIDADKYDIEVGVCYEISDNGDVLAILE